MERSPAHGELVLSIDAAALDVGLAGLAIETDTRLAPQRTVRLRIREDHERGEIELRGRVVWCFFHGTSEGGRGEHQPVYRAGIEFTDVLTPVAESLVRFLESHALAEAGETRLFGRFRLAAANAIRVELDASFRLTGLDGGEATVEAALPIEPTPGARARLDPRDGRPPIGAHVADLARHESSRELWRLRLALDEPAADEARLRGLLAGDEPPGPAGHPG
jgi:hypothetical protein